MIITKPGQDIINITEKDYNNEQLPITKKIHLIKIMFNSPSKEKMDWLIRIYPLTNRFVVSRDIKMYNWYFKQNNKKYYVENEHSKDFGLISFIKKNNKILLNFNNLRYDIKQFLLHDFVFQDILKNLEIIQIDNEIYQDKIPILNEWSGNVIISD